MESRRAECKGCGKLPKRALIGSFAPHSAAMSGRPSRIIIIPPRFKIPALADESLEVSRRNA